MKTAASVIAAAIASTGRTARRRSFVRGDARARVTVLGSSEEVKTASARGRIFVGDGAMCV